MSDLASGTSSRSSKLVHGGLRYLEQYEFSLVFEAVSERRTLMNIAPHLVNPLGFLFPVYKNSRRSAFTINLGMWLYDGLSLFRSPKLHRNLSRKEVKIEEPALNRKDLTGVPLYYDCATDDARLTLETALDAQRRGATIATYYKVERYLRNDAGLIKGVVVQDQLNRAAPPLEVHASAVINATGPWTDRTRSLGDRKASSRLRPTKGIHIVVDSERLKLNNAVVCFHPEDGRVLFALPWGKRTYIGTTDSDYHGDPSLVAASAEDVDYLIAASNSYFPNIDLVREDVISTWAGVRPLIVGIGGVQAEPSKHGSTAAAEEEEVDESSISREHDVRIDPDGLITIAGGKLTTYRRMGKEVISKAVEYLSLTGRLSRGLGSSNTADEPLPGAVGWPEDDDIASVVAQITEITGQLISNESAELLANTYGMCGLDVAQMVADNPALGEALVEGRPELLAQVNYGVEHELAVTVADIMIRRTQLFFRDVDQGLGCASVVAAQMAELLGWDDERVGTELEQYREEVQRSRGWQEE